MPNLADLLSRSAVDELPKGPTGKILKREITPPLATASANPMSDQG
jgi:hypothetical protein